MSKKLYSIINTNIQEEIIARRRAKWGNEQVAVYIKQAGNAYSSTYDIIEAMDLAIGIKITEFVNGEERRQYAPAPVFFVNGDVTEDNIKKAIDYLVNYKCEIDLVPGLPLQAVNVNSLKENN